jgi:hypothetical protein
MTVALRLWWRNGAGVAASGGNIVLTGNVKERLWRIVA